MICLVLPSELCLKGVCIRGLNESDCAALQLSHVRFLSVVSPLISLLSKLLKLIFVLQLLARVKLHFYQLSSFQQINVKPIRIFQGGIGSRTISQAIKN